VEEGRSHLHVRRGRPAGGSTPTIINVKEQARSELDITLSQAISSVISDKRPTKCFLWDAAGTLQYQVKASFGDVQEDKETPEVWVN
jgi:hypothetical protein